jgi:hypothetical protein
MFTKKSDAAAVEEFVQANNIKRSKPRLRKKPKGGKRFRKYKGLKYFRDRLRAGCPCCSGQLVPAVNPLGGRFHQCPIGGWESYCIGYREDENGGEERVF